MKPAETYEALFVPAMFGRWTAQVIDAVGVPSGADVLDVACGTGILARTLGPMVGTAGSVTGVDLNDDMLAVARERAPELTWQVGDAAALPFEDATFDRVVSQFGLMLFPDPVAALRELRRVCKPSGRIGVAVWAGLDDCAGYADLIALLDRVYSVAVGNGLRAPFALGDAATLRGLFVEAGMPDVTLVSSSLPAHFPSLRDWLSADVWGWLARDHDFSDADFEVLVAEAKTTLGPYVQPDGSVSVPMGAHIVSVS